MERRMPAAMRYPHITRWLFMAVCKVITTVVGVNSREASAARRSRRRTNQPGIAEGALKLILGNNIQIGFGSGPVAGFLGVAERPVVRPY
jgi:hypothetical protein